jgi:hypothetical protein
MEVVCELKSENLPFSQKPLHSHFFVLLCPHPRFYAPINATMPKTVYAMAVRKASQLKSTAFIEGSGDERVQRGNLLSKVAKREY